MSYIKIYSKRGGGGGGGMVPPSPWSMVYAIKLFIVIHGFFRKKSVEYNSTIHLFTKIERLAI